MDNGFIDVWNVVVVKFVFMENSKAYVKNATVLLSAFMDVCDVDASCAAAVQFVNTTKLRFIVMNAKEVRFVNTVKANDNVNFVKATVYVCICFRNVDVRNAAVIKYVSTVNLKTSCALCDGSHLCKSRKEPYNTGCSTHGNRKLSGFCSHCFVNIFPDDPRALNVRKKSKEIQVVSHILSKYHEFKHDKPFYVDLEGGCCETKRRIDLRKLFNNTMLCIEIDENQHKRYIKQDENNRYDDLFMDFSGKFIFIRYNPDKFVDKYGKSKNPMFETRMEVLEKTVNKHIDRINNNENKELMEIHHLFYNEN